MNALLFAAALFALGAQDAPTVVQTEPTTQLYVKTVPPGATVVIDGKTVGKSDGLFNVTPGAHKVTLQIEGYKSEERSINAVEDEIARIKVKLAKEEEKAADTESTEAQPVEETEKPVAGKPGELSRDNGKMANKMSIAGGGHAVKFKVDGDSWKVTSVRLHGSRYGMPQPPKEDFNVWICDAQFKPIATFHFPYSSFTRSDPVWKSFRIRPTSVPEDFIVCFGFNPEATKGVYVSHDGKPSETSMIGVPDKGEPKPFAKGNWMIRCKVEK